MIIHTIQFHEKIGKHSKIILNICFLELSEKYHTPKHAYIVLYTKTEVYRGIHYFSYFCSKHRLLVLVRTARRLHRGIYYFSYFCSMFLTEL